MEVQLLLYESSRQKLGWQFTACFHIPLRVGEYSSSTSYVQRAVNRQPGFRSDHLIDEELNLIFLLFYLGKLPYNIPEHTYWASEFILKLPWIFQNFTPEFDLSENTLPLISSSFLISFWGFVPANRSFWYRRTGWMKMFLPNLSLIFVKTQPSMTQNIAGRWENWPATSSALVPYVQRAVNRQPGFRSDQLVDEEFTFIFHLF